MRKNLIALALPLALLSGVVPAEEVLEPIAADITQTTCAELAEESEMDRAFSLIFFYGYLAGRSGVETIDAGAVTGHLEAVRDFCNANPDSTVIEAFVSALQE